MEGFEPEVIVTGSTCLLQGALRLPWREGIVRWGGAAAVVQACVEGAWPHDGTGAAEERTGVEKFQGEI